MAAYHFQQGDRPLDGYTIQYALGRGGFGEVYFAVSDAGREVALKAVQNFEEVELRGIGHCMNLKSPHLVMIFDIKHAADGTPWVIMEYVSGPSLREILDESPDGLSIEQTTFFLKELAKGLSYLHEAGVVHRDLKPHNVFFEDGVVKIGDYSLSKVMTASHRSGNTMTVGSVHYMAPEISLGRYDKTVDIYALGVILHEMLTGEPPHVGESMGEVLMKHLTSDPDVSQLSEPFATVIVKAMQRDPASRFQTAEEMVVAITNSDSDQSPDDSFNPSTLSLVGERARQAKAEQGAFAGNAAPNPPATHRSTAPTAEVHAETSQQQAAANAPVVPRRRGLLHTLGLHYRPAERLHAIPDSLRWHTRLSLAFVVTLLLVTLGATYEPTVVQTWSNILVTTLWTMVNCGIVCWACCRWLPFRNGVWLGLLSRLGWIVPSGLVTIVLLNMMYGSTARQWAPLVWAALLAMLLPDLRCLIASDRRTRLMPILTLVVGVTAAVCGAWFEVRRDIHLMSAAIAMALAIAVQLLAPLRQAAADAPLNEVRKKTAKPRLLYDGPAMFLELVVAASMALIIGIVTNARDESEAFVFATITAAIGGFALRFRLHRRAWPAPPTSQHPGAIREQGTTSGKVVFDWLSVFLELLVVVSVMFVIALMIDGDDDLFALGVALAVIGILALRYRLHRRRRVRRPSVDTKSRLSFDALSVFLELLLAACVVVVVAVLFEGDDDLFVVAAVAAALGVVVLRFRLARRLQSEQSSRESGRSRSSGDMAERHPERQEIH